MARVMAAGAVYFALVFAAGFVLGTVRTLLLEPFAGPFWAVVAEMPVILGVSWLAAGAVIRRLRVAPRHCARLGMGATAFLLLLAAELLLTMALSGAGLAAFLAALATPEGALGFAGQGLFALFPWLRLGVSKE